MQLWPALVCRPASAHPGPQWQIGDCCAAIPPSGMLQCICTKQPIFLRTASATLEIYSKLFPRRFPLPGCYNPNLPTLVSTTACPRHLCTSKPGQAKNEKLGDGGVEEVVKAGEELKLKSGEEMRMKLGEERMFDLGRGEDRPKLQTPRVSTR